MKYLRQLYIQVIIGVILGIIVGYFFPTLSGAGKMIGECYINLIKMLIAPLIFFTITAGIAGTGNLKKAGRIGGKALIYFEIIFPDGQIALEGIVECVLGQLGPVEHACAIFFKIGNT